MKEINDRTINPEDRRELAQSLREIRTHYRSIRKRHAGWLFCRAVLGNFYTGIATASPKEVPA